MPNDPKYAPGALYGGMWHLPQIWAPTAWAARTGTKATKVCVIDTGARRTHQDLAANIVGGWNRWQAGAVAARRGGGMCPPSGPDAQRPALFMPSRRRRAAPLPAGPCTTRVQTPRSRCPAPTCTTTSATGRGTARTTAGSVGAAGNNGLGVTGVAWNVSLYICRAATLNEGFYTSALLDCYYLCRQVGGEAQAGLD